MKKNGPKIKYDKESQVLSIEFAKAKSVDSDIQRNAVIDYDKKGEIVRINLYKFNFDDFKENAKVFKEFSRSLQIA